MFGDCGLPRIAWQIDPFGHSSEVGKEFSDMGFEAVFFGRINQDDYLTRLDTRTMEMIWKPNENEDGKRWLRGFLTILLCGGYPQIIRAKTFTYICLFRPTMF